MGESTCGLKVGQEMSVIGQKFYQLAEIITLLENSLDTLQGCIAPVLTSESNEPSNETLPVQPKDVQQISPLAHEIEFSITRVKRTEERLRMIIARIEL